VIYVREVALVESKFAQMLRLDERPKLIHIFNELRPKMLNVLGVSHPTILITTPIADKAVLLHLKEFGPALADHPEPRHEHRIGLEDSNVYRPLEPYTPSFDLMRKWRLMLHLRKTITKMSPEQPQLRYAQGRKRLELSAESDLDDWRTLEAWVMC